MTYDYGELVELRAAFRNAAGVLADPTTVAFATLAPDGTEASYTWAGGAVTRESLGTFVYQFVPPQAGFWQYRADTTGDPTTAEAGTFYVQGRWG